MRDYLTRPAKDPNESRAPHPHEQSWKPATLFAEPGDHENRGLGDSPMDELGSWLKRPFSVESAKRWAANPWAKRAGLLVVGLLALNLVWSSVGGWVTTQYHTAESAVSGAAPSTGMAAWIPASKQTPPERAMFVFSDPFEKIQARSESQDGLVLYSESMGLGDYRLDFHVELDGNPVSWTVRAADDRNYELLTFATGKDGHQLQRRVIENGAAVGDVQSFPVPDELIREESNKIAVKMNHSSVGVMLNGFNVATWSDANRTSGGVGFVVDNATAAKRLGQVTVMGNQDQFGRFLRGAHNFYAKL